MLAVGQSRVDLSSDSLGFTLIELVLVLSILAIMVSYALPQNSDLNARRLKQEEQRLSYLMRQANRQALLEMRHFGLGIAHNTYTFFRLNDKHWQPIHRPALLKPHSLPAAAIFKLKLEGREIQLTKEAVTQPQIFFSSDGQLSAFELSLLYADKGLKLNINNHDMRNTWNAL